MEEMEPEDVVRTILTTDLAKIGSESSLKKLINA
jgi:hypothetical protein